MLPSALLLRLWNSALLFGFVLSQNSTSQTTSISHGRLVLIGAPVATFDVRKLTACTYDSICLLSFNLPLWTSDWQLNCENGILEPAMAVFTNRVIYEGASSPDFTYSIDFVMQWSDKVTLNSTINGLELGIAYENILTYLYPSAGVYDTVFTAIIRAEDEVIDDFPDLVETSVAGKVLLEEESCAYSFSTESPSMSPTTAPPTNSAGTKAALQARRTILMTLLAFVAGRVASIQC